MYRRQMAHALLAKCPPRGPGLPTVCRRLSTTQRRPPSDLNWPAIDHPDHDGVRADPKAAMQSARGPCETCELPGNRGGLWQRRRLAFQPQHWQPRSSLNEPSWSSAVPVTFALPGTCSLVKAVCCAKPQNNAQHDVNLRSGGRQSLTNTRAAECLLGSEEGRGIYQFMGAYCPNNQTTIFDALNEAGC